MSGIRVGALTWEVSEWGESFFPQDLPDEWRLPYYANEFHTVVIDMDSLIQEDIDGLSDMVMDCHEEFRVILKTTDFKASKNLIQALIDNIDQSGNDCIAGVWHYLPASANETLKPVIDDPKAVEGSPRPALLTIDLEADLRGIAGKVREFLDRHDEHSDRYIIATSGYEDIQKLRQLVEIIRLTAS
ncbi:MAG: hypothetical protein EP297_10925 [Gammaproteobacteria bacterium]|nr:MAG: hypothetical protein EP297_10925 [Gammaproteobacteria bacterium]